MIWHKISSPPTRHPLHEAEELIAVLGGLEEVKVLGGFEHQGAGVLYALAVVSEGLGNIRFTAHSGKTLWNGR